MLQSCCSVYTWQFRQPHHYITKLHLITLLNVAKLLFHVWMAVITMTIIDEHYFTIRICMGDKPRFNLGFAVWGWGESCNAFSRDTGEVWMFALQGKLDWQSEITHAHSVKHVRSTKASWPLTSSWVIEPAKPRAITHYASSHHWSWVGWTVLCPPSQ